VEAFGRGLQMLVLVGQLLTSNTYNSKRGRDVR
jgi:hypothetical protein